MSEAMQYTPFKARWVQGSPFELQKTDHANQPLPENKYHWYVGFAVPKGPEWDAVFATMQQAAQSDQHAAMLMGQPGFNWKIEDADAPANPTNAGKPSYPAGHMIIKFVRYATIGEMPIVDGNYLPLTKDKVKRGDWFYVAGSTKFNGAQTVKTNAGMYQNIDALMFAEAGEEIKGEASFNPAQAFAGLQGGTATQGSAPAGGAFGQPQPQQQAAPAPQPDAAPAPQAAKVYVHTATDFTKEQYIAVGHTEDTLVAQGKGHWQEAAPAPTQPSGPAAPTGPAGVQPHRDILDQPGVVKQ